MVIGLANVPKAMVQEYLVGNVLNAVNEVKNKKNND